MITERDLDPFGCNVSVQERANRLRTFTLEECHKALKHARCLQETTRKALLARIRRLELEATRG